MLPEIYSLDQLEGTYYVEFQQSDGTSSIEHWNQNSTFCKPEVLELALPAFTSQKIKIHFFRDNFLTLQDCELLNNGLAELKKEIEQLGTEEFRSWMNNHEFSKNFLYEFEGKIDGELQNQLTTFISELQTLTERTITEKLGLRVLGI